MSRQSLMIRASAGSGKTYQLANRFLGLLALGVEPSSIIALTFTRKAAGEFADRILARLAEGASSPEKAAKLSKELESVLLGESISGQPPLAGTDESFPPLDQARFLQLLEGTARSLDRLALGTIDAFFGKIARNSWTDLGLAGFELLDEAQKEAERERVFGKIFSKLQEKEVGRAEFLRAFKLATFGAEENRFVETLNDFIDKSHQLFLKVRDSEAWGNPQRLWPEGCPWPKYDSRLFKQWTEKLEQLTSDRVWEHKSFGSSWVKFLEFLKSYEPAKPKFEPPLFEKYLGPNLRDLATGKAAWMYTKKEIRMEGEAAMLTANLVAAMVGAEIDLALLRTQGMRDILQAYDREFDSEVRRRGRLGFSDLTSVLAAAGIGESALGQNIGYRLDQRFEHWMLDEFQDTDRQQWQVLAGLIDEIAQEEDGRRTFFVVGDPKQGIHAWRGGEPRLFDEIAAAWQHRLPEWSMDRSFRSSPAVLDFVNLVCDREGRGLRAVFESGPFAAAALERWQFHPHVAARTDRRGESLVIEVATAADANRDDEVEFAGDGGEDANGQTKTKRLPWLAVPAVIERTRPLDRGLTCAILVQTNNNAAELADFLRQECPHLPIEVESETATQNAGPVVAALYDYFRWLQTPADRFLWGHVRHCPLHATLVEAFGTTHPHLLWSSAAAVFQTGGVAGLLDRIFPVLRHRNELDPSQLARLPLWETEARRFDTRGGTLADWVRLLRHWKTREWSGAGAIQIMTVHKAKGLEFDLVILPDLDGTAFDHLGKLERLQERAPDGQIHLLMNAPPKATYLADQRVAAMRDEWEAELTYERFCMLYVALTRAARGLVLILPPSRKANGEPVKAQKNHAGWLRAAVEGKAPRDPALEIPGLDVRTLWQHGDAGWFEEFPLRPVEPMVAEAFVLAPPVARMARKTPSGEKAATTAVASDAIPDSAGGMAFGTALHQAFEEIAWLDDGPPKLPADETVRSRIEACLQAQEIQALFTRGGRDIVLMREQPFDAISGNVWTSGVIDRLHLHRENGQFTHAEIIDFKTDKVSGGGELLERYTGQMRAYRQAVADATGLASEAVRCLLISTRLAAIVEIPHP